jgi:hypothetical protein
MADVRRIEERGFEKLRGRDRRSLNLSTKLTASEQKMIEEAASRAGKTPSEWARDTLLIAAGTSSDQLMTEIVGLQLFLTNALSPVVRGERMSAEQYQELMRNVKLNKHRAAREVVAQYAADRQEDHHG